MSAPLRVALIGLGAGAAGAFLPDIIGRLVVFAGAVLAGWVLPGEPVKAAAFFVLPAALLSAVRFMLDDEADVPPAAFLIAVVFALVLAAIFTHVGAGIALRRQQS